MACCAPEAVPLRLLLQPRPGLDGTLGPDVAPALVPLLDNRLAAGDAVAALLSGDRYLGPIHPL